MCLTSVGGYISSVRESATFIFLAGSKAIYNTPLINKGTQRFRGSTSSIPCTFATWHRKDCRISYIGWRPGPENESRTRSCRIRISKSIEKHAQILPPRFRLAPRSQRLLALNKSNCCFSLSYRVVMIC